MNLAYSLSGFCVGVSYSLAKAKENEVKQGKNYLIASFFQTDQLLLMTGGGVRLTDKISFHPLRIGAKIVLSTILPVVGVAFSYFSATVRNGVYSTYRGWLHWANQFLDQERPKIGPLSIGWRVCYLSISSFARFALRILPLDPSVRTKKIASFFAEHMGDVAGIVIVAESVALIALGPRGFRFFGSFLLVGLGYGTLRQRGWIPEKVRLLEAKLFPPLSAANSLFSPSWCARLVAIWRILFAIPTVYFFAQAKLDRFARNFVQRLGFQEFKTGPSFEDIDRPLSNSEPPYETLLGILGGTITPVIDWAHCSKAFYQTVPLPTSREFEEFRRLFDAISWDEKYSLVKAKCRDDDRFVDFLVEKIEKPGEVDSLKPKEGDTQSQRNQRALLFESFLDEAAAKSEPAGTSQKFLLGWFRLQMDTFIRLLKGEAVDFGAVSDLEEVRNLCAVILPYLQRTDISPVTKEDLLLRLAVEGGGYCARGAKRVAKQIVDEIEFGGGTADFQMLLERTVYCHCERIRSTLLEESYQEAVQHLPSSVTQDVHWMDSYRIYLGLTFLPLSHSERYRITMDQLCTHLMYEPVFNCPMYKKYQTTLKQKVRDNITSMEMVTYLQHRIAHNKLLTEVQKQTLFEGCTDEETMLALFLVFLGIFRSPTIATARRGGMVRAEAQVPHFA